MGFMEWLQDTFGSGGGTSGDNRPGAPSNPAPPGTSGNPNTPPVATKPELSVGDSTGGGGFWNALFGKRGSTYDGVNRSNTVLPGFNQIWDREDQLGASFGTRTGPQYWGQQQQHVGNRLNALMSGQDSMSQQQLRQATDANIAQQRSLAASAAPGSGAMAQRMAMQNIGQMNQGYNQAATMAGIQERNAAAQALAGLSGQARGQDQQLMALNDAGANAAYDRQLQAAQAQQGGGISYEGQRTQRYGADLGVPTMGEQILGGVTAALPFLAKSDRALKTDIRPGAPQANAFMDSLSPSTYQYKNPGGIGMPPGKHTGVMAQDLEKTPAGKGAVINTSGGKTVDFGQLGGVMAASLATLNDRLKAIESGKPKFDVQLGEAQIETAPNAAPRSVKTKAEFDAYNAGRLGRPAGSVASREEFEAYRMGMGDRR